MLQIALNSLRERIKAALDTPAKRWLMVAYLASFALVAAEDSYAKFIVANNQDFCDGITLFTENAYGAALPHFVRLYRLDPDDWTKAMFLAECYLDLGKPNLGIKPLQHALRLDPSNDCVRFDLAECLCRVGDIPEARRDWMIVQKGAIPGSSYAVETAADLQKYH